MRKAALQLQHKAEAGRSRARERWPNKSKEQLRVRCFHATLVEANTEAMGPGRDTALSSRATQLSMKALGIEHLPEALL